MPVAHAAVLQKFLARFECGFPWPGSGHGVIGLPNIQIRQTKKLYVHIMGHEEIALRQEGFS